jgi:S-adenosylmethionine:tRNA ribosyltransferase-isomerase
MKTTELDYELPSELIAQDPVAVRSESRLLVLDRSTGTLLDSAFSRLGEFLRPGDCLVLNDTKVLPARFFARRETGGKLEGLFLCEALTPGPAVRKPSDAEIAALGCASLAIVSNTHHVIARPDASLPPRRRGKQSPATEVERVKCGARVWEVMLRGARKVKLDESIHIEDRRQRDFCMARVVEKKQDGVCLLEVATQATAEAVLNEVGFPPLPPYIRRSPRSNRTASDLQRYQTVYARYPGAVAAPTAGLHFTDELMGRLKAAGIGFACVTLHVGAGTFKPIATEQVEEHEIHREWYRIDAENAGTIRAVRQNGGRVIAVGTTVTRVLETVAGAGPVTACEGTTRLFITPGYEFKAVDAMITNFHLPRSTLLALVGAFAGLERTRAAYRHAIEHRYRFYSYGDAMLIL